jgi:hypothetical protein
MIGKKDDKTCNKDRNSTKLQREHAVAVAVAAEDVAVAHGEWVGGGLHWHSWRITGKQDHPFVRRKG